MLVAHVHHRNDNGDDTIALQCVLNYDLERTQLLEEEARLVAQQRDVDKDVVTGKGDLKLNGATEDKDMSERLQEIYERLEYIDAYSAESPHNIYSCKTQLHPRYATKTNKGIFWKVVYEYCSCM